MEEFDPKVRCQKGRESEQYKYYALEERESEKAAQKGTASLCELP